MSSHESPSEIRARCLRLLTDARLPFLVGGAYALRQHCNIRRDTKDLDLFAKREAVDPILAVLSRAGYRTELTFPHWLAKAHSGDEFIDVIFNSGNGLTPVDETWFDHAKDAIVLGVPVRVTAVEEAVWSKAFVMERERFDGADVLHLFSVNVETIDWKRLVARFGKNWRVLLAHLSLFQFVYPDESARVPSWVVADLSRRFAAEGPRAEVPQLCRGTLLSREQYLPDLDCGYVDARLAPLGTMTREAVDLWTRAISSRK